MAYSNSILREMLKYFARPIGPSAMLRIGRPTAYNAALIFSAMGSSCCKATMLRA
jgi:hypothetical protein